MKKKFAERNTQGIQSCSGSRHSARGLQYIRVAFKGSTVYIRVSVSTTKPSETRSRSIEENTRLRSRCETSLSRREVGTLDSFRFLHVAPLLVIFPPSSSSPAEYPQQSRNGSVFEQPPSSFFAIAVIARLV